ncbi:MAG: hypothetical protein KAH67_01765 [Flavobacteriaceae bacterium]|nr:hypothetical protein [Flavobacteriaceae bacterium]
MSLKLIFYVCMVLTILSCGKTESKNEMISKKDSTFTSVTKTNNVIAKLSIKAKDIVKDWQEYQNFDEFINQYQTISTNDALLNAKELSDFAQQLKDSIRIEKLNISSVKIRLNVLHNESLRLADMSTIDHIKEQEVNQETENILNAFSALNLKINNIISQENLNSEIEDFIDEVKNLPDTTKKASSFSKKDTLVKYEVKK